MKAFFFFKHRDYADLNRSHTSKSVQYYIGIVSLLKSPRNRNRLPNNSVQRVGCDVLMKYLIYIRHQVAYYLTISLNITHIIKFQLSLQLPQFNRYNLKIARLKFKKIKFLTHLIDVLFDNLLSVITL